MIAHDILSPAVRKEYERWYKLVGYNDPYASPNTLGVHDVLKAHFLIIDFFYANGTKIGGVGPRDLELLHSALLRQCITFENKTKWHDVFDICATLMYGLIMNHPFHDANKRTAFLSTLLYLYRQKYVPNTTHDVFENLTIEIADHKLDRHPRYLRFKEEGNDPEVKYISYFIKHNTRQMDKRYYTVTYNDLHQILKRFDFGLDDPNHNCINVVRYEKAIVGIFKKREEITKKTIAQIGFPGWTKQVGKGAIKTVRQSTGLVPEKGYDSQTFYHGVGDTKILIAHYQEPLQRLANK